jgi:hypothetical protein
MTDESISYINTDLELASGHALTDLTGAFRARGAFILHLRQDDDRVWYATIEIIDPCRPTHEPEIDISTLLAIVESLEEPLRAVWWGCSRREFDIGYRCGSKPRPFNQCLSHELVQRMAAAGASLRITLYPPCRENSASSDAVPEISEVPHGNKPTQ